MTTLHIEHQVTDFETWSKAFQRLAPARHEAGVRAARIHRRIDRPSYVVIDLDFDTTDAAQQFLRFLQTQVWKNPENSPALAGTPETMILEPVLIGPG